MKTYLECIPCFFNQVLQAGKRSNLTSAQVKVMMDAVGDELKRFPLDASPPEMAPIIQELYTDLVGISDPYKSVKDMSNEKALAIYPELKAIVERSAAPLLTAVELACAGNIIDYGATHHDLDVNGEIMRILSQSDAAIAHEERELFAFEAFQQDLSKARRLMYVGDNCGEIVFDRVLIETIAALHPSLHIDFVTRGTPILNDCLVEDAYTCGLHHSATIVSSGMVSPGLILKHAAPEFKAIFDQADIIISKGQGNYEALSGVDAPIYFLLITKCKVIARDLGSSMRDLILKKQKL